MLPKYFNNCSSTLERACQQGTVAQLGIPLHDLILYLPTWRCRLEEILQQRKLFSTRSKMHKSFEILLTRKCQDSSIKYNIQPHSSPSKEPLIFENKVMKKIIQPEMSCNAKSKHNHHIHCNEFEPHSSSRTKK